jgi:hypothetical protein
LFIEGKSKAKITFGTIKSQASAYVDLDMEPRKAFKIFLKKAQLNYDLPDEVTESFQVFDEGQELEFRTAKSYYVGNADYLGLLAGFLMLGVVPVLYSNRLKSRRLKIYKSN